MTDAAPQRPLRIGDPAPDFEARTTRGPRRLGDYRGRWLMLFSHPADFTPVSASEFVAFARRQPDFDALGCDLMALSADSLYAHLAWLRDIRDNFGARVEFPVVEDPSRVLAGAFGMTAADGAATRATAVIDPDGVVRAVSGYPANVGRSADELLRLVRALQAADRHGASTPEGWLPGQPLLDPAPVDLDAALDDAGSGPWYYRERRP